MKKWFGPVSLIALAAVISSCGGTKNNDPFKDALTEAIQKQSTEQFVSVEYSLFERIDSSTYNDELVRRRKVFEIKDKQDESLYFKYIGENKKKNAGIQREKVLKNKTVLHKLDSLAESFGPRAEDIAFYDYCFSVVAKGKTVVYKLDNAYASITPDFQVVGLTSDRKDIHKSTGKAIPGYLEIIKEY